MNNRLRDLRTERGWTQADLAQHVRVSRQTINAIEKGKFDASLPLAFRLARLFDLKIEEVFLLYTGRPSTIQVSPAADGHLWIGGSVTRLIRIEGVVGV